MRPDDFPTARVHAKNAAGHVAQVGAVLKHRGAIAGRAIVYVVRGVLVGSFVFGLIGWIVMHASAPRRHDFDPSRYQIPQYDYAQMQRELAAIERAHPFYIAPPPVVVAPKQLP